MVVSSSFIFKASASVTWFTFLFLSLSFAARWFIFRLGRADADILHKFYTNSSLICQKPRGTQKLIKTLSSPIDLWIPCFVLQQRGKISAQKNRFIVYEFSVFFSCFTCNCVLTLSWFILIVVLLFSDYHYRAFFPCLLCCGRQL